MVLAYSVSYTAITIQFRTFPSPSKEIHACLPAVSLTLVPLSSPGNHCSTFSMVCPFWKFHVRWNHITCDPFVSGYFTCVPYFQGSSRLQHLSVLHSSLWMNNIPLYGWTTFQPVVYWMTFRLFPLGWWIHALKHSFVSFCTHINFFNSLALL